LATLLLELSEIGIAHEHFNDLDGQPQIEHDMDTGNNQVGLGIGKDKCVDCAEACSKAVDDGTLKCIVAGELVPCTRKPKKGGK